MRLPRRVPWASIAELDQVCAWIYADENDVQAKLMALQRLSAWKNITALPHALESTLALLSTMVQDASAQSSSSYLHMRQSYASALIRLVNGLVDPLQLGSYARSIASIAAQLNLPAWLVELRHAATHEDLPSLDVLREAARDSMTWLLHNYFLPSINPMLPPSTPVPSLRPITPLLKRYKNLLKITTRDASLRSKYQPEISKALRDIERWIAEAKVAADTSAAGLDWDTGEDEAGAVGDGREQWALETLSDALVEKGGLVSASRKKRAVISSSFIPPPGMIAVWAPLINHLHALHASLPAVLASRIVIHLTRKNSTPKDYAAEETIELNSESSGVDVSYDMCIASWANWLVNTFGSTAGVEEEESELSPEDLIVSLVTNLGPSRSENSAVYKAAHQLLETLCARYSHLQQFLTVLPSALAPSFAWDGQDLQTMKDRLHALLSHRTAEVQLPHAVQDGEAEITPEMPRSVLPPGWRALSAHDGWRSVPIGSAPLL